jgi:ribosomal protein L40E
MAQKTIGYVELEWACPNCGAKNPGTAKTCKACGAPQPQNVQFEQAPDAQLLEDEAKIARAQKGPDIHCPYCGTRNPADAASCAQCGGDLAEGTRRTAGQVIGAFSTSPVTVEPVHCPHCGTENPGTNKTCRACGANLKSGAPAPAAPTSPTKPKPAPKALWLLIPLGAMLLLCCGLLFAFAFRTSESRGVVQSATWERIINIQAQVEVTREAWWDELPQGTQPNSCTEKLRRTENQPVANAREVCGTPYSKDTGSGFAEVVQDCVYEVYEDYCQYTAREWRDVDAAVASGNDYNPYWPQPQLKSGQREGERTEKYRILFSTDEGPKEFSTSNESLFRELQPGTEWTLEMNVFGAIVSVRR